MAEAMSPVGKTGEVSIEPLDSELPDDWDDLDPEKLRECEYWRCGELFETKTSNQVFCRKACRSRQRKWERAQARKERKQAPRRGR